MKTINANSLYSGILQYPRVVQDYWESQPNYLIEYNAQCDNKEYCAVYFCSNDIWYPHTEEIFRKRIVEKNFYEWYHCRIDYAYKHIFMRDVFKQWYVTGINGIINNQEKLLDFLKNETEGYKVVTVGSSAGGYAAALFGPQLDAEKNICFNAQFNLNRLVKESTSACNPILYSALKPLGGGKNILHKNITSQVFYIYSNHSKWDMEQHGYIKGIEAVRCIEFNSSRHGIPFLKVALHDFINMNTHSLNKLSEKVNNPILFTIKMVGVFKTISSFFNQAYKAYKKRH